MAFMGKVHSYYSVIKLFNLLNSLVWGDSNDSTSKLTICLRDCKTEELLRTVGFFFITIGFKTIKVVLNQKLCKSRNNVFTLDNFTGFLVRNILY